MSVNFFSSRWLSLTYPDSGFFRKRKSVVSSVQAGIIIDKHELHSTWPVYNQPESRSIVIDSITLTVERSQTCYGPGDRISVMATVKSDSLSTLILRGFDISLRETTAFKAGHYSSKKFAPPPPSSVSISESKLPVNTALYGGTHHRAELSCIISPTHTTTSLNTARHIDITYVLCIKALIDTLPPIIMELPVIVSNWQRFVNILMPCFPANRIHQKCFLRSYPVYFIPLVTNTQTNMNLYQTDWAYSQFITATYQFPYATRLSSRTCTQDPSCGRYIAFVGVSKT